MRRCLAALAALSFAISAHAGTPFPGSTVFIPPLVTKDSPVHPPLSTRVLRLPPQAGLVRNIITTNLLDKGPSWLANGDQYWSLCAPNRTKVACSPLVSKAIMRDIDVRTYAGENNVPMVAFDIHPKTTRTATELAVSIDYFQARLDKKVAHFNRMATLYVPPPPRTGPPPMRPGTNPNSGKAAPLLIAEINGSCVYDDFGDLDCSGGTGGEGGTGTEADQYDWSNETEWEATEDTTATPLPTFPSGVDNGNVDPCIGPNGSNICQQVEIVEVRQDYGNCTGGPLIRICTRLPPVVGDPSDAMPKSPTPWFAQSTCNKRHWLCSRGQVPEELPRIEPTGETYEEYVAACEANLEFRTDRCTADKSSDSRGQRACKAEAFADYSACLSTARARFPDR